MWMAWFKCRLPRRESRWTFLPPEDTSIGAVPLKAAKWCRLGKRATSPVIPIAVPATTGPTPKILVVEVPDALTTAASRLRDSLIWASRRRRSSSSSSASSTRATVTALSGFTEASNLAAFPA